MMKETFGVWQPIRSGSATKLSDALSVARKKDKEIYVPVANEPTA